MGTAQLARNLASAATDALVQVAWRQSPFRVRHALDREGHPLLLCRAGGALDQALTSNDAAVLNICGRAGQVWLAGWATPATDPEATLDFAATNPVGDLLDVGHGYGIYRIDLAEVRLQRGAGPILEVDVEDYASAFSEPVI